MRPSTLFVSSRCRVRAMLSSGSRVSRLWLVVALLLACGGSEQTRPASKSAASVEANRFVSETLGFSIARPEGWHFETAQLAERDHTKNGQETFGALQRKYEHEPFVTLLKYEQASSKLNPSVKVTLRPLAELQDKPPKQIASMVASGMKQTIPTFALLEPVRETELSGRRAGFLHAHFKAEDRASGITHHVRSRMWLVPRGDRLFIIGMSAPAEGEDTCEAEFAAIAASIEIDELE